MKLLLNCLWMRICVKGYYFHVYLWLTKVRYFLSMKLVLKDSAAYNAGKKNGAGQTELLCSKTSLDSFVWNSLGFFFPFFFSLSPPLFLRSFVFSSPRSPAGVISPHFYVPWVGLAPQKSPSPSPHRVWSHSPALWLRHMDLCPAPIW